MRRYLVRMTYQIQVEAATDSEAIQAAQRKSVYGEETVRYLEQRIARVIESPEVPQTKATDSGTGLLSGMVSGALDHPKAVQESDIPF